MSGEMPAVSGETMDPYVDAHLKETRKVEPAETEQIRISIKASERPETDPATIETEERKRAGFAASFDQLIDSNLKLVGELKELVVTARRAVLMAYIVLCVMLVMSSTMFVVVLTGR